MTIATLLVLMAKTFGKTTANNCYYARLIATTIGKKAYTHCYSADCDCNDHRQAPCQQLLLCSFGLHLPSVRAPQDDGNDSLDAQSNPSDAQSNPNDSLDAQSNPSDAPTRQAQNCKLTTASSQLQARHGVQGDPFQNAALALVPIRIAVVQPDRGTRREETRTRWAWKRTQLSNALNQTQLPSGVTTTP